MSNIIDATQRMLDETIGGDAHTWLRDHGVTLDTPPRPRPITADDLTSPPTVSPEASAFGGASSPPDPSPGRIEPVMPPAPSAFGSVSPLRSPSPPGGGAPTVSPTASGFGGGSPTPGSPPAGTVSSPLPPSAPSAPAVGVGGPSVAGAAMPPAAATAPLSPQSLGQSFTTGMTTARGNRTPAATGATPDDTHGHHTDSRDRHHGRDSPHPRQRADPQPGTDRATNHRQRQRHDTHRAHGR